MADLLSQARAALASRFRVERELGRGGMATVFLAEDLKHSRLLAVKILHPDLAAAIGPDRFRAEIAFAAHLNHPHILALIDSGEDAGLLWYAMPYVEGETLRERLTREGRLSLAEVADLAAQVASALDYAHGLGILHRDIKPENLLLAHGHAWVADFGIAKALRQSAEASGAFEAGTPGYMSPEQMAGEPLDRRADVFSLGAVVYECLTARRPFPDFERRKDLFGRHRKPGRISLTRPEVPPRLEAVVRHALAPMPSERQATAGEFAQAIARAVTDPKVEKATRKGWLRGGLVTFTLFAGAAAAYVWSTRPPEYDDNRVVILPVRGPAALVGGWGEDLGVALEAQFNSTRFLVARSARDDSAAAEAAAATRSRWSVQPEAFSDGTLRVTLWDHEQQLGGKEEFGVPAEGGVFATAVAIATALVPQVMPTGGQIDQSVFGQSNVEALASFLRGERAYRAGRFAAADSLFDEAVRLDSGFTWAALRGAQAASWRTNHPRALELVRLALRTTDSMAPRYAAFANGLEDYQTGQADSAIMHLREAIRLDSLWTEAHTALAEVYHHYLPQEGSPLDSARKYFQAARAFDPAFTPPLFHQIQIAVWDGDRRAADSLMVQYQRTEAEPGERVQADLMSACLRGELSPERWSRAMADTATLGPAAQAAVWLAVGGMGNAGCAEDGLRAIPADPARAGFFAAWGPMALGHSFAARGDSAALREVLETAGLTTFPRAYLTIATAAAGLPIGRDLVDSARAALLRRVGSPADTAPSGQVQTRWLLGVWAAARGDTVEASDWLAALEGLRPDPRVAAQRARLATSLEARIALARGDTIGSLPLLEGLAPGVRQGELRWQPWLAFPHERMLRVRIYQARGETRRAAEVAAGFDSPASYGLLPYLPESLQRRRALAERRGEVEYLARITARLHGLRAAGLGDPP